MMVDLSRKTHKELIQMVKARGCELRELKFELRQVKQTATVLDQSGRSALLKWMQATEALHALRMTRRPLWYVIQTWYVRVFR
jgi:hypothetical protein